MLRVRVRVGQDRVGQDGTGWDGMGQDRVILDCSMTCYDMIQLDATYHATYSAVRRFSSAGTNEFAAIR